MASYYSSWVATDDWRLRLDITETSGSSGYTYTARLYVNTQFGRWNSQNFSWSITIDGSTTSGTYTGAVGTNATIQVGSASKTISRGTSAKSISFSASGRLPNTSISNAYRNGTSCSGSMTLPALASYTVSYNANGGSGVPGTQTKWYGQTLKLSSAKPTRTGYTFAGWATSSGGSVAYQPGGNYTANSAVTLYAKWTANTWTISYNANGGSGAPSSQTKTYGITLHLSSTKPTRTNYNFLGWATSATATTPDYQPGAAFTVNATITLYAVWEIAYTYPVISKLTVDRCTSSGVVSDEGTYALVTFLWSVDSVYSGGGDHAVIGYRRAGMSYSDVTVSLSGMSGQISQLIGSGLLDTEYSYDIRVEVFDTKDSTEVTRVIPPLAYIIDFSPEGGVAIGKPAPSSQSLEVDITSTFNKSVYLNSGLEFGYDTRVNIGNMTVANMTESQRIQLLNHTQIANGKWLQGGLSSGGFADMLRMSEDDRVELNWTQGGLSGRVMKLLWSGTLSEGGSVTIPDLPYYTTFAIGLSAGEHLGFCFKGEIPGIYPGRLAWDQNTNTLLGFGAYCTIEGTKFTYVSGRGVNVLAPSAWNVSIRIFTVYGVL